MDIRDAQQDMRDAYFNGAPGVFASATAWLAAAAVAWMQSTQAGVLTLFFGGMLIHPAGIALEKALGRSGRHRRDNPLAGLAIESTVLMLLAIPVAYAAFLHRPAWFFCAMLLIIGGRYLVFTTLYGLRVYWLCGATLAAAGFASAVVNAPAPLVALASALIEYVFAAILFSSGRRESRVNVGNIA